MSHSPGVPRGAPASGWTTRPLGSPWRHLLLTAALCCLAACSREAASTKLADEPGGARSLAARPDYQEENNVIALSAGAVVIDRTGEMNLGSTPVQALDALLDTVWTTPPQETKQSFTVLLPVPTTIDAFVLSNVASNNFGRDVKSLQIDYSSDGAAFTPGTTVVATKRDYGQRFPVTPTTVRALRVTIAETFSPTAELAVLASLEARGRQEMPPAVPEVTGSWQVNDQVVRLKRIGHRVLGTIDGKLPLHLDGSITGNVIPFVWTRVNQAGYGLMTVDPSSQKLNALIWHERPIPLFVATTWFGSRLSRDVEFNMLTPDQMIGVSLNVIRRYSSYGVRFDAKGRLDPQSAEVLEGLAGFATRNPRFNFKLAAVYFSEGAAAADRLVTDRRVAIMRTHLASRQLVPANLEFVSSGATIDRDPPRGSVDRLLFDRVDLDVVGPHS